MNVPARAEYALRAVMVLARSGEDRLKGEAIAREAGVPLAFLKEILGELKRAGVIGSRTGHRGGYWILGDPKRVSLARVIEAVDGSSLVVGGRSYLDLNEGDTRDGLAELWSVMGGMLEGLSVADVSQRRIRERLVEVLDSSGPRTDPARAGGRARVTQKPAQPPAG